MVMELHCMAVGVGKTDSAFAVFVIIFQHF